MEGNEESKGTPLRNWLMTHVTWMATIIWFGLIVMKGLRVARGDLGTAMTLLASTNVLSIAFYVLAVAVPLALQVMSFFTIHVAFNDERRQSSRVLAIVACAFVLAAAFFTSPWILFAIAAAFALFSPILYVMGRRYARRKFENDPLSREIKAAAERIQNLRKGPTVAGSSERLDQEIASFKALKKRHAAVLDKLEDRVRTVVILSLVPNVLSIMSVVLSTGPWVPAERVKVSSPGSAIYVGYVIGDSSDWFTILEHEDRRVLRIHADRVDDRSYCQPPGPLPAATAWAVLSHEQPPRYPPCFPDLSKQEG